MAWAAGGDLVLRIEDIDQSRARPAWEAQIYDDLRWLGLCWPEPVMRQSDRMGFYNTALDTLWARGLLYPCTCSRRDIKEALSAPQEGAVGPDGLIYPGTCRDKAPRSEPRPAQATLRLDLTQLEESIYSFQELGGGPSGQTGIVVFSDEILRTEVGDLVLARRDMGTSYHLSVVLDDAAQGITHVVRGADLFEATKIHVLLQRLLDLPTPHYHHHRLIRDAGGKRLAKRDDARAIALYRETGTTPDEIRLIVGL